MKTKTIIAWRTFLTLPTTRDKYGKLIIELVCLTPEDNDRLPTPVPVFTQGYGDKETIEMSFQCGGLDDDHPDVRKWYAPRFTLKNESITGHSKLMPWFRRKFTDEWGYDHPMAIIDILIAHAPRVAYSGVLSGFVTASHWDTAESYRCYYDVGVPGKGDDGSCTIHAYSPADSTDEEITRAVSKALRSSTYITDENFAGWINNGSKWRPAFDSQAPHHRPHTMEEIFGSPTDARSSEAAA